MYCIESENMNWLVIANDRMQADSIVEKANDIGAKISLIAELLPGMGLLYRTDEQYSQITKG